MASPKGEFVEAVAQREIVAAIVARRQPLVGDEQVVQPPRPRQADLVGRVEHGGGIAQQFARALDGDRLQERLRRQPRPALEHVLQMRGRQPHMIGDILDRGLLAPAPGDDIRARGGWWRNRSRAGCGMSSMASSRHEVCPRYRARGPGPATRLRRARIRDRVPAPTQQRQRVAGEADEIVDQRGLRHARVRDGAPDHEGFEPQAPRRCRRRKRPRSRAACVSSHSPATARDRPCRAWPTSRATSSGARAIAPRSLASVSGAGS